MIRIGLTHSDKQHFINEYLKNNGIKKVYCFYFKKFKYEYEVPCEIEYIEYADIEMYKFFYRLLEEINDNSLIIMDECMRTQNRNELIYNCAKHYLNQTGHRIIFEYLPFIEDADDFMILMDLNKPGKYKGRRFDYSFLKDEDIKAKPIHFELDVVNIGHTDNELEKYNKKRDNLFDNLGMKDPETVPRALQLLAGDYKKKAIENGCIYMARNKRFKLKNVYTYDEAESDIQYIILDFHYRRLNMNDYLKKTGIRRIDYISTGLSIDNILITKFNEWIDRLEDFYAKADLY